MHRNLRDGIGAAHGEGVAGVGQFAVDPPGGEGQEAAAGLPQGIVRHVVPFPHGFQGGGVKGIVLRQGRIGVTGAGGEVHRLLGRFAVIPDHRHALFPAQGNQHGGAAHRAAILEENGVPAAVGGVHHAALGHALAVIALIVVEHDAAGKFSRQAVSGEAAFHPPPAVRQGMDGEQIISAVDLVEVGAFVAQGFGFFHGHQHPVKAPRLGAGEGVVQFRQADGAVAVNDVGFAPVEEQGGVMVQAGEDAQGPGAVFDVSRAVNVGFALIHHREAHGKHAVLPAQGGRPHALAVAILTVRQRAGVRFVQRVIEVAAPFPMDEIIGAQDGAAGGEVHGGADQVIGIVHPDHVGVGKIAAGEQA